MTELDKKEIENRDDIFTLVTTFYDKVKADDFIGPIFLETISDWDAHLVHLTDFWEMHLFTGKNFNGNPMKAHIDLDANYNHSITQEHFGRWLQLWLQTLEAHFYGEKAILAKERARHIASRLFMMMFNARPKE